jgi:two-component system cell cycle sensor histidine kinase/response regulator CckA
LAAPEAALGTRPVIGARRARTNVQQEARLMGVGVARAVLIVEDERIIARDLQLTLRDLGYDAYAIASSTEEALARAAERVPDLVLMDIRLKGASDGIEAATLLKATYGSPVVYLTAHADDATLERAKVTEPHGYLVKPVRADELRSVVELSLHRHAVERRLRERERWFSTTLRSISDAVISVDLDGNVTFMNAAAETLTGRKAAFALGRSVTDVVPMLDDHASGDRHPVLRALREGRSFQLPEARWLDPSTGQLRVIDDRVSPVVDDDRVVGAVMVFRDVTDGKRLQQRLELSHRLSALGAMAAGVAHEVNNPLSVVVANAELVAEELRDLRDADDGAAPPDDRRARLDRMSQALADVESAARRIARIVSDLKTVSRPPRETRERVDVIRCVEWALRTTAHEFRQRASLVTTLDPVPAVSADEAKVGQVIINLLVNAAHAIPPGSADRNQIRVGTHVDPRGLVVIEVEDTGSGITEEVLGKIFEPFFTTKAVEHGTGLGLSICHEIVSSLGGEIQVESELGRGTLVRVSLPAAPRERPSPDDAHAPSGGALGEGLEAAAP